jgi:hypothetical protein
MNFLERFYCQVFVLPVRFPRWRSPHFVRNQMHFAESVEGGQENWKNRVAEAVFDLNALFTKLLRLCNPEFQIPRVFCPKRIVIFKF